MIQRIVDVVGIDALIDQFLRGTPDALWDLAEQAVPGLGRQAPKALDDAQRALIQGQRAQVANGAVP